MLQHVFVETVVGLVVTIAVCRLYKHDPDIGEILAGVISGGIAVVAILCFLF